MARMITGKPGLDAGIVCLLVLVLVILCNVYSPFGHGGYLVQRAEQISIKMGDWRHDFPDFLEMEGKEAVSPLEPDRTRRTVKTEVKKAREMLGNRKIHLAELRDEGQVILPSKHYLTNMSDSALFHTYMSYLDNIEIICHRKFRMGNLGDGGWEVCDDMPFRPGGPCLVYSFGIDDDFTFDDAIAYNYDCQVFSFDPTMSSESYRRSNLVYFYQLGIAGDEKHPLHTIGYLKSHFGHEKRVLDVLKMDVEYFEWDSLPQLIASGELRLVRQLLLEYHGAHTDRTLLLGRLGVLKDLYDLGFRKFYVHKNPVCANDDSAYPVRTTRCFEVHYVNTNIPLNLFLNV